MDRPLLGIGVAILVQGVSTAAMRLLEANTDMFYPKLNYTTTTLTSRSNVKKRDDRLTPRAAAPIEEREMELLSCIPIKKSGLSKQLQRFILGI
jgi:hypothetical protein